MTPGVLGSLITEHEYATTDKKRPSRATAADGVMLAALPLRG